MDKVPPPPQPWYQRRRRDPGHVPQDAADLGTAFGLDMSLLETPTDQDAPSRDAAVAGWAQRMLARGRRG